MFEWIRMLRIRLIHPHPHPHHLHRLHRHRRRCFIDDIESLALDLKHSNKILIND